MPSELVDQFGRTWTLEGTNYVCDGITVSAAVNPLSTMNAMAPEGYVPPADPVE